MKIKICLVLGCVMAALAVTGCYKKVSGGSRMGVPFISWSKSKVYGVYEKPVDQVYNAALTVITQKGVVTSEGTSDPGTTNVLRTVVGRVEGRNIYVGVRPHEANFSLIEVQARTPAGVSDLALAHTLEKEIALQMVR
jgi:hypothetical protein